MSVLSWFVVSCTAVSTLALLVYVRVILPRRVEERIRGSLKAFSTAIELRFPSHQGLTERVIALSTALGRQMGLRSRALADIETAAHLRDIGLCAVPYRLINEVPPNEWTGRDYEMYERHGDISANMLETVPSLQRYARIVRGHHLPYREDAAGYRVFGRILPLEARILSVVTAYTWQERYQGDFLARETLREGRGTLFDPQVVDAFLGVLTSSRARDAADSIAVR